MPDAEDERVRQVAREIEDYLRAHPQAADSLEGIATWWVSRQRIQDEVEVVQAALVELSRAGVLLEALDPMGGQPIYRLKRLTH